MTDILDIIIQYLRVARKAVGPKQIKMAMRASRALASAIDAASSRPDGGLPVRPRAPKKINGVVSVETVTAETVAGVSVGDRVELLSSANEPGVVVTVTRLIPMMGIDSGKQPHFLEERQWRKIDR